MIIKLLDFIVLLIGSFRLHNVVSYYQTMFENKHRNLKKIKMYKILHLILKIDNIIYKLIFNIFRLLLLSPSANKLIFKNII